MYAVIYKLTVVRVTMDPLYKIDITGTIMRWSTVERGYS